MQDALMAFVLVAIPGGFLVWVGTRFARSAPEIKPWWHFAFLFIWGAYPMLQLAKVGNSQLNALMQYDVDAGLTTPDQVAAAERILGLMQPLLEESLKAVALIVVFLLASRHYRTIKDGMYYASAVGLGYGIAENHLYIQAALTNSGIGIALAVTITRSLVFGLLHVIWCTPFAVALSKTRSCRFWAACLVIPCVGFSAGVLMHGLHNASFLWVQLQRSYGVVSVVMSLMIYAVAYITWLVVAFKTKSHEES